MKSGEMLKGEAGGRISNKIVQEKKSPAGKALLAVAFFTCPCHLPIYILLLGGTALGGYITENKILSVTALSAAFVFSLLAGIQMIKSKQTG